MTKDRKGTLFVFISAVLYSIGGLCMKLIPWNGLAINGGRTAIALLVVGTYLALTKHPVHFNRWVLVGGLSVFGANALFAAANKMTTAANAIVLQFTAPVFVMLFAFLLFRKKPTRLDCLTCIVVFGGILCFFVDSLETGNLLGDLTALLSGVAYAGVFLMNELPGGDSFSSVVLGYVFSAATGLPFLFRETEFPTTAVVSLVILGVFQVGLAHVMLCTGLKTTPPVTASLVSGIEPILNPILVAVFYEEKVGKFSLVGAAIVITGVLGYHVLKARGGKDAPTP